MKITNKMKNYEPLIIPISKPIENLTEAEAANYNQWFLENIGFRVDYLLEKVSSDYALKKEKIKYSEESLLYIWRWFLEKAEISKTPLKVLREIRKEMKGHPKSLINYTVEQHKEEFSVFTKYLMRDIGMYLGGMFVSKYSSISWSYKTKPKNYAYVNEPLLIGFIDNNPDYPKPFNYELEPIGAIECLALNMFEGSQKESDLLDLYHDMLLLIPNR